LRQSTVVKLAELGYAVPPGSVQEVGQDLEGELGWGGVVRGMLDSRSNAYVEAMNGLLQQVKRAVRGFRTATNFIAVAYLRMSKLRHMPSNPLQPATPKYNVLSCTTLRQHKDHQHPHGQVGGKVEYRQPGRPGLIRHAAWPGQLKFP
jgi:hypothetical protein